MSDAIKSNNIDSVFRSAIAQEVMETRKLFGWTRRELAAAFGVTEITVSRWETAARTVPPETLRLLRAARMKYAETNPTGRAPASIMHPD